MHNPLWMWPASKNLWHFLKAYVLKVKLPRGVSFLFVLMRQTLYVSQAGLESTAILLPRLLSVLVHKAFWICFVCKVAKDLHAQTGKAALSSSSLFRGSMHFRGPCELWGPPLVWGRWGGEGIRPAAAVGAHVCLFSRSTAYKFSESPHAKRSSQLYLIKVVLRAPSVPSSRSWHVWGSQEQKACFLISVHI